VWRSSAAVIVVCLAVGLQTVRSDNYFLGDDFGLVHHLHDLPPQRLLTYFVSDWTEGTYGMVLDELRPVLALSYWLDAHLFGPVNAFGYHVTNLILHILNALLVLGIARSVAPREPAFALLAASLFALMPSHAEPIAWISGRVDSLASLFYLGALLCFVRFRLEHRRRWLLTALAIFSCGLFAKQSVVTFPALIIAFDWLWPAERRPEGEPGTKNGGGRWFARAWPHIPFIVVAALYLALRQVLFGNSVREDLLTMDAFREFILRQARYARALMPAADTAPRALQLMAEVLCIGILAVCARWVFVRRPEYQPARRRLLFFGVAWYAITIAPMIVTYVSARHLYITSAGLSVALASLILPTYPVEARRIRIRAWMAGTIIALYAVASIWNTAEWVGVGTDSRRFASAVHRLLQSVPRGSTVFVRAPDRHRGHWFWSWATPFALQPPFTDEDLYTTFRIVERPEAYCCPLDQWLAVRKDTLTALITSPDPQQVTDIEFLAESPGAPRFSTRTVEPQALRHRIEAALEKPVESLVSAMTPEEGEQLIRLVLQ
jgi:hypothetical protein